MTRTKVMDLLAKAMDKEFPPWREGYPPELDYEGARKLVMRFSHYLGWETAKELFIKPHDNQGS